MSFRGAKSDSFTSKLSPDQQSYVVGVLNELKIKRISNPPIYSDTESYFFITFEFIELDIDNRSTSNSIIITIDKTDTIKIQNDYYRIISDEEEVILTSYSLYEYIKEEMLIK